MQLKEFSLISPQVESGTVLKALETAIPTEAIEITLAQTHSHEERKRAIPVTSGDLSSDWHEFMVKSVF
jgi:hypothetical protein